MVDGVGVHRFHDADVVGNFTHLREQFADPGAVLTFLRELEDRRSTGKTILTRRHRRNALTIADRIGQVLVEVLSQFRLVVPQIKLRRTIGHKQPDDPFCFGGVMQCGHDPVSASRSGSQIIGEDAGVHAGTECCGTQARG